MTTAAFALTALLVAQSPNAVFTGTLNDRLVPSPQLIRLDFKPSTLTGLAGQTPADKVLSVTVRNLESKGLPNVEIALVERGGIFHLYVDRDRDGHLEQVADLVDTTTVTSWDHMWEVPGPDSMVLPVKARLIVDRSRPTPAWTLYVPAAFRVAGHVEIGGRRILVSLPFKAATGTADPVNGYIGIDSNGDGSIDTKGLSREYVNAAGAPVTLRAGDRYMAIESADFAKRSFVVRERPASDYALMDVHMGEPLADFSFVDFDGRNRTLSEFRGKYVLLDFWGSWCKPCVEDVPMMKEAYARFQAKGFEIVGLDYEMAGTADKVRPLLKEKDVRWTNGTPESVRSLVNERFRINAFPTLFLLDPKGVVIETRSAELRGKRLIATLERVLGK